jgi:hypothetical protein
MLLVYDKIKCYESDCCGLIVEDKVEVEPKIIPLNDAIKSH